MKTLNELLKQEPVFLNDWAESKKIGVLSDFEDVDITKDEYEATECPIPNKEYWLEEKAKMDKAIEDYKNINILFASYGCANYSGDAFVLFEKEGKLFEVNGGHCSCYGLEGQFKPEETTLEALRHRLVEGKMGQDDYSDNEFANELKQFLGVQ
jgi:hypothetical protein